MSKVKPDSIFMLVDKVNAIQKLFHRTSIKLDLMMLEKMGKNHALVADPHLSL